MPANEGRPPAHAIDHRLSYGDCDPAGIVYYATWFPLMERVHTEWWFLMGHRFDEFAERYDAVPVVRHTECSYLAMATLFDVVRCGLRVEGIGRSSYRLRFDFTRASDGAVVARGQLSLVAVNAKGLAVALPKEVRKVLEEHL